MHIPIYKRILSYLYPIRLRKSSSIHNPVLELLLYQGRLQLATEDAIYSDGAAYRPLLLAFTLLPAAKLQALKHVLLLGTGLGSAIDILTKMNSHPHYTLVELDETVLDWAVEAHDRIPNQHPVCTDAQAFVANDTRQYDMLVIDIFKSRVVPGFVTEEAFLQQCRRRVSTGGIVIINYIEQNASEWEAALKCINTVFTGARVLSSGINRIVVATV